MQPVPYHPQWVAYLHLYVRLFEASHFVQTEDFCNCMPPLQGVITRGAYDQALEVVICLLLFELIDSSWKFASTKRDRSE